MIPFAAVLPDAKLIISKLSIWPRVGGPRAPGRFSIHGACGLRASVGECGGPPPLWNTSPLANLRHHGSFAHAASLREP